MEPYERFEAWKQAHAFAQEIYKATKRWPSEERFGLTSQVRRSAFSVAANIVEGSARRGKAEFRRFLDISHASMAESGYTLRLARDLGYLSPDEFARLDSLRASAGRLVFLLLRSMST
jgi:four helix bundle protein